MTEFERNARYSYQQTLDKLIADGWKFPHLQTMNYKGFDVITWGDKSRNRIGNWHGFHAKFFLNGKLVKIRDKAWKDDINAYCRTYIDQVLLKLYVNELKDS